MRHHTKCVMQPQTGPRLRRYKLGDAPYSEDLSLLPVLQSLCVRLGEKCSLKSLDCADKAASACLLQTTQLNFSRLHLPPARVV